MSSLAPLDAVHPDLARLPVVFVNAYFVGEPGGPWILVDTGVPGATALVVGAAEARFGADARPEAIVLTHGHFDHAGSAEALADHWDVPIYAHPLERPFLTGRSHYAPGDPTVGGAIAQMSRAFPSPLYDFGARLRDLPEDGSVPGAPGWRWVHTPGHTNGHVSLWRESDRTLIAGDALTTMDLDSWSAQITKPREFDRPPAPLTPDWPSAHQSVRALAALGPQTVVAGHGLPVSGVDVAGRLFALADGFPIPEHGRYVTEPAIADETGIVSLPPPVPDPFAPRMAAAAALAGFVAGRKL